MAAIKVTEMAEENESALRPHRLIRDGGDDDLAQVGDSGEHLRAGDVGMQRHALHRPGVVRDLHRESSPFFGCQREPE